MKQILLFIIVTLVITSCSTTKNLSTNQLNGKWSLSNYSVYMSIELDENTTFPAYNLGDVVWTFDTKKSSVTVVKKNPNEMNEFSLKEGTYIYTKKEQTINIDGIDYLIYFNPDDGTEDFNSQGQLIEKPKREILILDSNTDPTISGHNPVLSFYKMQ